MSTTAPDAPEVRLANDIAAQFAHLPATEAAQSVADHLRRFWDPRMRAHLVAYVDEPHPALTATVVAAAALLR